MHILKYFAYKFWPMQKNDSHSGKDKVELEGMRLGNGDLCKKKWNISQGWFEEGLDKIVVSMKMHFSLRCASALCLKWKWKWKSLSCIWLFVTPGLYIPWNSPGQDIGVGSLSLLQDIFPTQESNRGILHCRWILYQLSYKGMASPMSSEPKR